MNALGGHTNRPKREEVLKVSFTPLLTSTAFMVAVRTPKLGLARQKAAILVNGNIGANAHFDI